MKFKMFTNTLGMSLRVVCVGMVAALTVACSDDKVDEAANTPYDPNKAVTISRFTPEEGGLYDQILIFGSNFGNDKDYVKLTIGGKNATIVSVMNDKLYGYVPAGAFEGTIELTVTNEAGQEQTAVAAKKFAYEHKTIVGTLCGYRNAQDDQGTMYGPFETTTGFDYEGTMCFDPLNKNLLYITYDNSHHVVALDLEKREHYRLFERAKFGDQRLRQMAFNIVVPGSKYQTEAGKYMLMSTDRDNGNFHTPSLWIVTRNANGTFSGSSSAQNLASYKQCNGVAVHPINGEVYFNSYSGGQLFRLDLDDYFASKDPENTNAKTWTGYLENGCFRELFKIMDPSYEFNITIHPSGKYAYINVINRSYILRTDYNEEKKEFTAPYTIAGSNGKGGWVDGAGGRSRINRPYQGIFVKNPQYVAEGRQDVYDYYFADNQNYCIRYISPDGVVTTYAGHSHSTDGNLWGTEDGDLRKQARFRDVSGIEYDVEREMFYVLDHNNRSVRYIGMEALEDEEEEDPAPAPDEGGEGGENTEE